MEIMNWRQRDNAWRPIPQKLQIANPPATSLNLSIEAWNLVKMWIHVQDDISNYIGLHKVSDISYQLYNMGKTSDNFTLITDKDLIKTYSGDVDVITVKRFLIVIHDNGLDRFLYKDGEYNLISAVSKPNIALNIKDQTLYTTDEVSTAEAILGKYRAKLNEISRDEGKLTGGIMFRAAYRLFDGSYVMHTIPSYVELGLAMQLTEKQVHDDAQENDLRTVKFYASNLEVKLWKTAVANIDTDIFTHIVIFACKNESIYQFDEDTFDQDFLIDWAEEVLDTLGSGYQQVDFKDIFDTVNPDFEKMADSAGWYKIHEIDIKEIQDSANAEWVEDIDTKRFWLDYATRETLPVDQFSHHSLSASYGMNYNSRLILADVSTEFGSYVPFFGQLGLPLTYPLGGDFAAFDSFRHTYLLWTLKTDEGEIKQLSNLGDLGFSVKTGEPSTKKYCMFPPVLGYPDSRATKLEILTDDGTGQYYKIQSFNLKKSTSGNYAYYHSDNFDINLTFELGSGKNFGWLYFYSEFTEAEQINIELYLVAQTLSDSNRIQVSEVNNPFYFPAENSYQVGIGKIIACAANTEPLSTGQFGEYPLQVFTSKGIWAMMQGQGDVVFSNIVPSGSEVIKEGTTPVSTGNAVVFLNEKDWIFALSGRDIRRLSTPLDNPQSVDFLNNVNLQYFIAHANIVQLSDYVDTDSLKVYMSGALLGFDKENNELLITNESYDYSYIFSFDSGFWYKISESYSVLINNYPFLEGLNSRGLIRISTETSTDKVQALFVTREQSLDFNEIYKKIDRSLIRICGTTNSNKYAGYYIFGSDDLYNWQLSGGNDKKFGSIKDIRASRSHKKWKYYIFVLAVELSTDAILSFIDTQFLLKANRKLR